MMNTKKIFAVLSTMIMSLNFISCQKVIDWNVTDAQPSTEATEPVYTTAPNPASVSVAPTTEFRDTEINVPLSEIKVECITEHYIATLNGVPEEFKFVGETNNHLVFSYYHDGFLSVLVVGGPGNMKVVHFSEESEPTISWIDGYVFIDSPSKGFHILNIDETSESSEEPDNFYTIHMAPYEYTWAVNVPADATYCGWTWANNLKRDAYMLFVTEHSLYLVNANGMQRNDYPDQSFDPQKIEVVDHTVWMYDKSRVFETETIDGVSFIYF